jgi:hypothetical protein
MLLQDTLEALVIDPPNPLKRPQHLCLDKGYSGAPCDATARVFGYPPARPPDRLGEVRRQGPQATSGASLGGRTRPRLVERLSLDLDSLGQEVIQLPRIHRTRFSVTVVSTTQAACSALR